MIHALLAIFIIHIGVNFVGWSLSGSQPAVTTSLSAGITASDTTIPVQSVAGYPSAGWLYIGGEAMSYSASASSCPAPFGSEPACFTGASRGGIQTTATSHPARARVYDEASGALNALAGFESRTAVTDLGDVTSPWGAGPAIIGFLSHATTWDWPMFEGDFAFFRIIGVLLTTSIMLGIFYLLAQLLMNSVGSVLRAIRP